jgi:hypothetical protein
MKLQRTPLILLVTALLLGGVVYLAELRNTGNQTATTATKSEPLFGFQEAEVRSLSLALPQRILRFEKVPAGQVKAAPKLGATASPQPTPATSPTPSPSPSPNNTTSPVPPQPANAEIWMMTTPTKTIANDASVAYLLNLLATGERQQNLSVPATRKAEFGLDAPSAIAEVKLSNQKTHRLVLGKPNFNRTGLYALVDPPSDSKADLSVVLVPIDFETAVSRPIDEWKDKSTQTEPKSGGKPASSTPAPVSSTPQSSPTASPTGTEPPVEEPSAD